MKKIGIVGSFGLGMNLADGQNVKSNNIYNALLTKYKKEDITILDTHAHSKKLLSIFFKSLFIALTCKNIIIMPAQNGIKVFVPLFVFLNKLMHRSLHYVVIGGWLGEFLTNKPRLIKQLKGFDGIYPETNTLANELLDLGLSNCYVLPNFKDLQIVSKNNLNYHREIPFKICTFSRVMKKKGITDLIEAVKSVNQESSQKLYDLDIYGSIDPSYQSEFDELLSYASDCVQYKGVVSSDKSVEIIKQYFMLVFPTKFETEGVPGTIIDAYASGVPVLSARWKSFYDIVDENITGFGFEQNNVDDLMCVLNSLALNVNSVNSMKETCLIKAEKFLPQNAINVLVDRLQ